jgi:hypothetical protein
MKNRRIIPHRFESVGYVPVRNDAAKDGLWKIDGARQTVYAKKSLPLNERLEAVAALQRGRAEMAAKRSAERTPADAVEHWKKEAQTAAQWARGAKIAEKKAEAARATAEPYLREVRFEEKAAQQPKVVNIREKGKK